MARLRLDQLLVQRGLCDSREQAKRLILAGEVVVQGLSKVKPGQNVAEDAEIRVKEKPKYVGRGGLKLEGALKAFGIDPTGNVGVDIGSSTGGFTDCLLQAGAKKVFAFDVGTNQLVWKLRDDPRVVSREKFNCRNLTAEDVGEPADIVVMDVSFISLTKILPAAFSVLAEQGNLICLIKPQFELERGEVGKGGIVREPELHDKAVAKIRKFATEELNKQWRGLTDSPITGTDGNREFLAWMGH
ncbi:MAG: 23S rRNA (cytidine1920-2'-O)/16S rRNA (cytidine1409-2'-O)-methyltransferase [Verrucomicrobiales bacterium]|jgi:23S rRNA (cytidine1920-2'-O)/16S rRNA (cytidine1409-2'-O)-methyltransferase